jgi:hypothetical protein
MAGALTWSLRPTWVDGFKAEQIAAKLSGDFDAGLNACIECCDRHAQPGRVALFWEGSDGRSETHTFEKLREHSARLANFLRSAVCSRGTGLLDFCRAFRNCWS